MKLNIFVHEQYLENLFMFLSDGVERPIEWHHDRPHHLQGVFYMVCIDYDDFVRLNDLSE